MNKFHIVSDYTLKKEAHLKTLQKRLNVEEEILKTTPKEINLFGWPSAVYQTFVDEQKAKIKNLKIEIVIAQDELNAAKELDQLVADARKEAAEKEHQEMLKAILEIDPKILGIITSRGNTAIENIRKAEDAADSWNSKKTTAEKILAAAEKLGYRRNV